LAYDQGIEALKTDPAEAAKLFEAAQQAAPAKPQPAAALATARLQMAERASGAEKRRLLGQAAAASQTAVALAPSAANYLTQGIALQRGGKLAEAEAALRKATELDSSLAGAWYALGMVLNEAGKPDEAAAALETAVQRDPKNDSARLLLAAVLTRKNPAEAQKHVDILMHDPNVTARNREAARRISVKAKK
jgi:tetratricopeptide (TPR) repeat protein